MMIVTMIAAVPCGNANQNNEQPLGGDNDSTVTVGISKVYFTKDINSEGLVKIYEALGRPASGRVAVKISTGEPGGHNFLQPELIKDLVHNVNGTIVECNTAYGGKRSTTEEHLQTAKDHGFTAIANVDIMDAEGDMRIPVKDSTHIKYDIVGSHLKNYDFMINLAHFKGHAMGGFGGVLKNQSIGVASANGKAYIHTAGKAQSPDELWENLPEQDYFLESMSAAAQAVADYFGDNILYINVMNNLSVDCDCDSHPHDPEMKDIGILASTDPVALDQACLDLVFNYTPSEDDDNASLLERINSRHGTHTVDYAEEIGLGSRQYQLINIEDNSIMNKNDNEMQHTASRLVAYFSATGTTKAVAQTLAKATDADIYEIRPEKLYTTADLDWQDNNSRSSVENANENSRPALADKNANIQNYDVIFLGFPIWWYRAPKIINTFLESYDFSGKTIILFATSGGSQLGETAKYLKGSCSKTTVIKDGKILSRNASEEELQKWVKSIGY